MKLTIGWFRALQNPPRICVTSSLGRLLLVFCPTLNCSSSSTKNFPIWQQGRLQPDTLSRWLTPC